MATDHNFEHILVPAKVADSGKLILVWDNNKKVSAKFHLRIMIFNDFLKNMIKDYGCPTPS